MRAANANRPGQHRCIAHARRPYASEVLGLSGAAEHDAAIYRFEQLLEKDPAHFLALHKLIVLLRHAGRLDEARPFVERARAANVKASKKRLIQSSSCTQVGLHFCAGLLAHYRNDPHEALAELNHARKDSEWGARALTTMAEVYIGADSLIDWSDESGDGAAAAGEPQLENLAAAERLLRELRPSKKQYECARETQHTKQKPGADLDLPVALQAPRARNHLKRIAKMYYQPEFADDFELGWLLLAHVYIQGGKYDIAEELCNRALAANRSCARAYELLGMVKEKELAYEDAARAYEKAWQLEREASASVGFKLAFNFLKSANLTHPPLPPLAMQAKEYVGAIDVCHKVLQAYPDYPKIREEILDKARMALRA
ncbi:hypothetical protein T492DRAFT_847184 [Pavlovales sp. CCMP2436]|nr:hypothetical protein T492DRAFT_847184 [Pavlovales sp. CCMP2436]